MGVFLRNITLTGGVASTRAYTGELMPDILDEIATGYPAMAHREALKVPIRP